VANISVPEEIAGALDTNCIFHFSLLVSAVRSAMAGSLKQIDGLILTQLSIGGLYSVLSLWGYRTCHYRVEGLSAVRHYGGFGTHFRLFLSVAICVFSLWFWAFGLQGPGHRGALPAVKKPDCGTLYTFFFARLDAKGGIRVFWIVDNIIATTYFGVMLLISSIAGFARAGKMIRLAGEKQWAASSRLLYRTGFNERE
jgi:hypothetical protein